MVGGEERSPGSQPPLLLPGVTLGLQAANMTFPLILHRLFRIKKEHLKL